MAHYRKDTKRWVAVWYDNSGKRKRKSFIDKKSAELYEARMTINLEKNRAFGFELGREAKVADLIESYLARCKANLRQSSYEEICRRINCVGEWLRNHDVIFYDQLKVATIQEYITHSLENHAKKNTINNKITAIKHMCKFAHENGRVNYNALEKLKRIRVDQKEVRILSKEDLAVIESIANEETQEIIFFLARTGLRVSELVNLIVNDVDFDNNRVRVRPEISKSRKLRLVPMTPGVRDLAQKKVNEAVTAQRDYIFCSKKGEKFSRQGISQRFKRLLTVAKAKGVNVDGVKLHSLRATYISHMLMNGQTAEKVMKIVGHADFSTMKKYMYLTDDFIQDVPEIF